MVERVKSRLDAQYIAKEIGVCKSYVSKMENERVPITKVLYKKWIEVLKLEI
jgi:transcriptional regulator with XRE-family HTH domain